MDRVIYNHIVWHTGGIYINILVISDRPRSLFYSTKKIKG
jgi:hypothetical protein